jgi:hypothetical protein
VTRNSSLWNCRSCGAAAVAEGGPPNWFKLSLVKRDSKAPPNSPRLGVFCCADCLVVGVLTFAYGMKEDAIREWLQGGAA